MKTHAEEKVAGGAAGEAGARGNRPRRITEPRWPVLVAMVAAGCLFLALPEPLSVGPDWALPAFVVALTIPVILLELIESGGRHRVQQILTLIANAAITLAMIASLILLIHGIPEHRYAPVLLLRSGCALWVTNVLVFAVWYWKLDAGGPLEREQRTGKLVSAFLFPQMVMSGDEPCKWSPHFIDYLFLAFNTSTAFSPTDTAVLSRWGKAGMMLQSVISLAIVAVVAARAVNIL